MCGVSWSWTWWNEIFMELISSYRVVLEWILDFGHGLGIRSSTRRVLHMNAFGLSRPYYDTRTFSSISIRVSFSFSLISHHRVLPVTPSYYPSTQLEVWAWNDDDTGLYNCQPEPEPEPEPWVVTVELNWNELNWIQVSAPLPGPLFGDGIWDMGYWARIWTVRIWTNGRYDRDRDLDEWISWFISLILHRALAVSLVLVSMNWWVWISFDFISESSRAHAEFKS